MSRLIEADAVCKILESCEIRKATIGNPLTDWEYGYTCGIERAESEIECAPTVDAVPVEWIKQWSKKPVTEKDTKLAEQCEWDILEWLIADWEAERKDNETD